MKTKLIGLGFLSVLLTACVAGNTGFKVDNAVFGEAILNRMVDDSVVRLTYTLPPAQTQLNFTQGMMDRFGAALALALRKQGYGVVDSSPQKNASSVVPNEATNTNNPGNALSYAVDKIDNGVYRVSLFVDTRTFSRAYVNAQNPYPIGVWSLSEK